MIPLFLGVIIVIIFGKLISFIGKETICEATWDTLVKIAPSKELKNLRETQRKAIDLYTKRSNTSSKDEFAKWAKLDREYAKTKTEIENINKNINGSKSQFKKIVKGGLFILTTGSKMYIRIKYRKSPVFYLPSGVFPKIALWFLSFSSAPMGSVSVSVWLFVANKAVDTLINTFTEVNQFSKQIPERTTKEDRTTMRQEAKAQARSENKKIEEINN